MVSDQIRNRVDRNLGQIMAIGGLLLFAGLVVGEASSLSSFAPAWLLLCAVVTLILAVNALAGHVLPIRFLRAGWVLVPVLAAVAQITTYFAYSGLFPREILSWQSVSIPAAMVFLTLWLPAQLAIVCSVVMALLTPLSSLLALGPVSSIALTNTPNQLTGIGMVLIFISVQHSLLRFRLNEAEAEDQELSRANAVARAEEEARLARLVHDEVLASLSAAMHTGGPPSAALRAGAERSLAVLDAGRLRAPSIDSPLSGDEIGESLRAIATELDAGISVSVEGGVEGGRPVEEHAENSRRSGVSVPPHVAEALIAAAAEALRNSVRHAGKGAAHSLCVRLGVGGVEIEVVDDGVGFDLSAVDPRRLGVRRSILEPVRALSQGSATVKSSPGNGTRVVLQWQA